MKKLIIGLVAGVMLASMATASRKDEVTLVMMPREDGVLRVGLDIANRYPTLLVSYKVLPNGVSLHGWNGQEWVNISLNDFHEGNFFRTGPDSALVVEQEGMTIPEIMIPPIGWCDAAYKITTTDTRPLLHLVGQYYDFKYKDWKWFSDNYKMSMEAINPEGLNVSWYHKRFGDHLKKGPVAADDLQYWVAIRHPEPVMVEMEVEVVAETNTVESAVQPEMELPEDPMVNPFTNDAPAAVVLGAGTAEEAAASTEKTPAAE
ncbi:hypothetical protein P4C99_10710 [Pontiellaceae bacterium B1224]|nr:hypothetical protein [Pontiellaceae bacterium B1224]